MKKLVECVKDALQTQNIKHIENDKNEYVTFECKVANWTVAMRVVCNDDAGVLAFLARFPNCVPKDKYLEVYPLLNAGNNRGGLSRICMDEETGTIRSVIFVFAEAENCTPEQIMTYVCLVVQEVAECYEKIMKVIYC